MGPALMALADGQLQEVSRNLMVAFSAVILALIASAITYGIASVRRRWLATELAEIEHENLPEAQEYDDPVAPLASPVAFTTVIAYYYIAETNVAYLTRNSLRRRATRLDTAPRRRPCPDPVPNP